MKYEMNCEFCGKTFTAAKSNAKFCDGNCRVKNHILNKKHKEEVVIEEAQIKVENNQHVDELKRQYREQEGFRKQYLDYWRELKEDIETLKHNIEVLKHDIRITEEEIQDNQERYQLLDTELALMAQKQEGLNKMPLHKDAGWANLFIAWNNINDNNKLSKEKRGKVEEFQGLKFTIKENKKLKAEDELALQRTKSELEEARAEIKEIHKRYEDTVKEKQRLKTLINKPTKKKRNVMTTSIHKPSAARRVVQKKDKNDREIGAGDLQDMDFDTYTLNSELGRFLGELDWNRTCFALTGDSGAGKTYFSFELANLIISSLDIRAKYFSLEEGIGKLTKEKVEQYNLGNELSITDKGDIEAVRIAAKEYPLIIVDSFNKLNAKAADFENLRTDFPKTLFILIFQKTTSGTMRGGSSIKYDSSATINVIKRDGERIAIMEKGRYGTIDWEYSIDAGKVIKEY